MSNKRKLLIIGGTGYLGQHLLQSFSESQKPFDLSIAFTHHSSPPPNLLLQSLPQATPFQVDLQSGQGFDSISRTFGQPDVVVNCAALSIPRACETNPAVAMSINVPSSLVNWLSSFTESNTLLIHLSTDQVYEGTKSFYKEDDETLPVNVYGKSKVEAEKHIIAKWSNFVILRSSIIFGPQTTSPVSKSLPIQDKTILTVTASLPVGQDSSIKVSTVLSYAIFCPTQKGGTEWMDSVLSKGQETDFFHDEFRCPVYVKDVVNVIRILTDRWISDGKEMNLLLNIGGPDRLSRVQMAETVARVRGYNTSLIKPVSASSIDRGVKSPSDISMDISKLIQTLDFRPMSFQDGVKLTIESMT